MMILKTVKENSDDTTYFQSERHGLSAAERNVSQCGVQFV